MALATNDIKTAMLNAYATARALDLTAHRRPRVDRRR
ncbi:hypothetical protein SEA_HIBISCUS_28 [Gordonia phage Hibiscus]